MAICSLNSGRIALPYLCDGINDLDLRNGCSGSLKGAPSTFGIISLSYSSIFYLFIFFHKAQSTLDVLVCNLNANALMLLVMCSVDTPKHTNRSYLLALCVCILCGLGLMKKKKKNNNNRRIREGYYSKGGWCTLERARTPISEIQKSFVPSTQTYAHKGNSSRIQRTNRHEMRAIPSTQQLGNVPSCLV